LIDEIFFDDVQASLASPGLLVSEEKGAHIREYGCKLGTSQRCLSELMYEGSAGLNIVLDCIPLSDVAWGCMGHLPQAPSGF